MKDKKCSQHIFIFKLKTVNLKLIKIWGVNNQICCIGTYFHG
jgi:hypothetical protein